MRRDFAAVWRTPLGYPIPLRQAHLVIWSDHNSRHGSGFNGEANAWTEFTDVTYKVDNGLAWITINRPDRYNAFRARTLTNWFGMFRNSLPIRAIESKPADMTIEDQPSDTGVGVPPAIIVVSLLNALAGLSLAAIGFKIDNSILVVVAIIGALVGSIAIPIAKAINRQTRWAVHIISSIEQAVEAIGHELDVSEWVDIDQERIDARRSLRPAHVSFARISVTRRKLCLNSW
jgi:hypothetical protein